MRDTKHNARAYATHQLSRLRRRRSRPKGVFGGRRASTTGSNKVSYYYRQLAKPGTHQVVDTIFDSLAQCQCFPLASDDNDYLTAVEDGLYTDGKSHTRHLADVVSEETGVGEDSVVREGLDARARGERRTRLVERDVPILADTAQEELDASVRFDPRLVRVALPDQVFGVAVQDVHLRRRDVDVREELAEHECVVGLWVVLGQSDVLVHVERHHMLESVQGLGDI